jgi:hypothetical protein
MEERFGGSLKYERVLPAKTVPNPAVGSTRLLEACDLKGRLLILRVKVQAPPLAAELEEMQELVALAVDAAAPRT